MQSLETAEQYSWKVHTANRQLWFLSKLPKGHECVCIVHVCIFMLPVVCAHMCYCVVHVCMLCSCGVCVWYMAACVLSVVCAHVCIVWCMCVWCSHGVCVCVCVKGAGTILTGVSDRNCHWSSLSLHLQSLWEQVSRDRRKILSAEEPILFPLGGIMMFSQWLHNSFHTRVAASCLSFVLHIFSHICPLSFNFIYRALVCFCHWKVFTVT